MAPELKKLGKTRSRTDTRTAASPVGYCPSCDYALMRPGICPECGALVREDKLRRKPGRVLRRRRFWQVVSALVIIAIPWGGFRYYRSGHWVKYVPTHVLMEWRDEYDWVERALVRRLERGLMSQAESDAYLSQCLVVRNTNDDSVPTTIALRLEFAVSSIHSIILSDNRFIRDASEVELVLDGRRFDAGFQTEVRESGELHIYSEVISPADLAGKSTVKYELKGAVNVRFFGLSVLPMERAIPGVFRLHRMPFQVSGIIRLQNSDSASSSD